MEERFQEVGVTEPVGGGEGLRTEVPAAMMTLVPLDSVGRVGAVVEALFLETPNY